MTKFSIKYHFHNIIACNGLERTMKRSRNLYVNWKAVDGAGKHGKRKLVIKKK